MNWYLKVGLALLVALILPCGFLLVGYFFRQQLRKPITVSEFKSRLKKLL